MRASSGGQEETSLAFGGQAVLEGVMIRSSTHMAISVRQPNGEILTMTEEISPISKRYRLLNLPFIRGIPALFETLYLGVKSLFLSANVVLEEEGEKLTYKEVAFTIVMILGIASFFIAVPLLLTAMLPFTGVLFNFVEGGVRLAIFLIYLQAISLWGEYKRVLQYHGAEHKTINAFEAGESLDVANVKRFSRRHPRCGTTFIFIIALVSIIVFSTIQTQTLLERLMYRVVFVPIISSISYEILKFSDRHRDSKIIKVLLTPGLRLQNLTTKEPDDDMIEVAVQSVEEVYKLREKSSSDS
ncbi:DUF1385 domain-containing protein [Candidatus Bathyarchaeota archaeon]|nr:DUF1385 domain-containing protein [Candidatus Bathyarchaeota archaeon]